MIDREDMMELTRRMTVKRHCLDRIAGAYYDSEGFPDGTFHLHFLKLSPAEMTSKLKIFKTVLYSGTNTALKEYGFSSGNKKQTDMRRLLTALLDCGMKNDALLETFYELYEDQSSSVRGAAILFCHGCYDVPEKASDKERLWESEEIFDFLICAVCPLLDDYEPDLPVCGFMYPSFSGRMADPEHILIYQNLKDPDGMGEALKDLLQV